MEMITDIVFPVSVTFADGEVEWYENVAALVCQLEDFDSEIDVACRVVDQLGRRLRLKLKLLELKELSLAATG